MISQANKLCVYAIVNSVNLMPCVVYFYITQLYLKCLGISIVGYHVVCSHAAIVLCHCYIFGAFDLSAALRKFSVERFNPVVSLDILDSLCQEAQQSGEGNDVDVGFTDAGCDDKDKEELLGSEESQQINDELEKEYIFALKKVRCLLQIYVCDLMNSFHT